MSGFVVVFAFVFRYICTVINTYICIYSLVLPGPRWPPIFRGEEEKENEHRGAREEVRFTDNWYPFNQISFQEP